MRVHNPLQTSDCTITRVNEILADSHVSCFSSSQKLQQSSSRKRKLPVPPESGPHKFAPVPHLIQGELARLDSRFKVSRDKSQLEDSDHNNGLGLRLQCVIGRY